MRAFWARAKRRLRLTCLSLHCCSVLWPVHVCASARPSGLDLAVPRGFLVKILWLWVWVLEEREKSLLAWLAPTRRRLWVSSFLL